MADPIVGITNGVPTSGTGQITTLGQTLLDGANITLGATTDLAPAAGAAGSISAHLRAISRDLIGGIVLQGGSNVIGSVNQGTSPWVVSGTIAATQSGTWNITNISGTISLPTGAATSALQPTNAALASTTAGQTGNLDMGAVTTAAPAYTNGTSNALSLTPVGNLRVDGSSVTQPISGTVSISGTVAVTESGTWTVQPGNTPNTVPWLMTIQQGGNPATVSAAGALKTDGSGVTQPISAAALPLPSGAATAALQPTNAAQGSTTSGQTGTLSEGAVATAAPSYTNGTTQPVSLTTAGAIRVDGSGVTQTVSGTVTANQGGTWSTRLQDGAGNAITSDARGTERPLSVQILDASGNQIVSFGAGSGPSFGSAFPATGQAVGMKDSTGTNMVSLNGNAAGALKVDGSGTTQPVSGTFWQTTQPVSGTFWQATQPVSAASLPLPSGAATSANQPTAAAVGSTTSGQTGGLSFGAVTTGLPAYTTGQSDPLSLSPSGLLRVDGSNVTQPISGSVSITGAIAVTQSGAWSITNISGTVSLPTGAATSANQPTNASLGSTTSGQTGGLALGAVTTAAPSYTTATSNALSLTPAGALRTDASATTQPISGSVTASQGGTWTVQPGNTPNTSPWLMTIQQGGNAAAVTAASALKVDGSAVTQPISGTITANQGGTWSSRIVGNAGGIFDFAGQAASQPANAILVGAEFNTTPTTLTSGQASPLQMDNAGNLKVNVVTGGSGGGGGTSSNFTSAFPSVGTAIGVMNSAGTAMTNLKVNASGALVTDGSAVTQPVSGTFWQATQPISGTVTANQGGTWNVTNISGTISLPTGAATSANQPSNAAAASTTTGQTGTMAMAAVTTTAPGYTTGQSNFLSMNTAGGLRVDGSGVTQPVSGTFWQATQPVSIAAAVTVAQATAANLNATVTGTVGATQSGTWNVRITGNAGVAIDAAQNAAAPANEMVVGGVYNSSAPTLTSGNASQLQLDASGNLNVNIKAGAGSGGTASSFGAAFPATGTAAGAEYLSTPPSLTTGQMVALQVTSAGSLHTTVDNSVAVTGTFWQATQPVSGTVTANQGGAPWSMKPDGTSWAMTSTSANVNVTNASIAVTGTFWQATQPVSIAAAVTVAQATAANLNATVTGTITANQGGAWTINPTTPANWGIGTSTQNSAMVANGQMVLGQYNLSPTSITSGNMSPLQLDSVGNLRVTINASNASIPVTQSGAWNVGQTSAFKIVGNAGGIFDAAQNAAAPANELVAGGVYNSTQPTLTSGNASQLQVDANGNLRVNIMAGAGSGGGTSSSFGATFPTTGTAAGAEYLSSPPSLTSGQMVALQVTSAGSLHATIDNTPAVAQSGTWNVGQTGTWQMNPLNSVSWGIMSSTQNQAPIANCVFVGGQYNSSPTTITSGNTSPLQLNASGSLKVDGSGVTQPISGSVTANIGTTAGLATSANQPAVTGQGNTTAGTTGTLAYATVATGTPAYSNGVNQPLNLDGGGNLKVNTIDPAVYNAGTAWNSSTALNTLATIINSTSVTFQTFIGQITTTTTITGGQITFEESFDNGTTYVTIPPQRFVDPTTYVPIANPVTLVASTNLHFHIIPAGTCQIRARLSTVIAGTGSSTISWTNSPGTSVELTNTMAAGDTANGATDPTTSWPVKIGGVASTSTTPAAVANGQRVNAQFDIHGKQIVLGAVRSNKSSVYSTLTTTTETTIVGATLNVFNDLYGLIVTNTSASAVIIDFRTTTGGSIVATLCIPANDSRGFMLAVDSAFPQVSVNTNWTAQLRAAATSVYITALFVQNN